jgi:predicted MFS family arabinose efflux permease
LTGQEQAAGVTSTPHTTPTSPPAAVGATLFASLFAGQAGLIALTPVLAQVARELDVSTAAAGQLRTVAGLAAGVTALMLGRVGRRLDLRRQLFLGTLLLALGSLASAAAPGFELLALAQVPVGAAVAVLVTAGTIAAAEWVAPELRARVLSWALVGQPAAWIVGMPLIGVLGERSWRLAWLAFPLAAAAVAMAALARHGVAPVARASDPAPLRVALADRSLARWLLAELLANTAWAGTLVYSGALFVESYGASGRTTGAVLALGAAAYVAGNRFGQHLLDTSRRGLVTLTLALAALDTGFGVLRWSLAASAALFAAAAFAAGGRTLISSAHGLSTRAELRPAAMSGRAATMQFGYVGGSLAGGAALAVGGYPGLGILVGTLLVAAAATFALGLSPRPSTLAGSVLASPRAHAVSVAGPSGSQLRRLAVADRGRKAAGAARDPAPEREPHGAAGPDRRRALGSGRPEVGPEDGAGLCLTAP